MVGFYIVSRRTSPSSAATPHATLGLLDILVDGLNLTARVGEGQTAPLLRDLALAVVELASGRRLRTAVRFYQRDEAWELGLLRDDTDVLLSVYRAGQSPDIAIHERRVGGVGLAQGTQEALIEVLSREPRSPDLEFARQALARHTSELGWSVSDPLPSVQSVSVEPQHDSGEAPLAFKCAVDLRYLGNRAKAPTSVERAELHSLLMRGHVSMRAHNNERAIGTLPVFLLAERLVAVARDALEHVGKKAALTRKIEAGAKKINVKVDHQGALEIQIPREPTENRGDTHAGLHADDFAKAVFAFGKEFARTVVRYDRSQSQNLRFRAFRADLRALGNSLATTLRTHDAQRNDMPESYRAFAMASSEQASAPSPSAPPRFGHARLRFSARWTGTVPGIDLRSTFLCGDRLIVTGSRETACLDRSNGQVLWKQPTAKAVAVPTPAGLGRIHSDGTLQILDYGNGEPALTVKLSPRRQGPPTGAVIHSPGLPKLIVVSEGEKSLSAVDLVTGEIRWRHTLPRGGAIRVRRAGRLLLATYATGSLDAIDVQTGELVWRIPDSRPFVMSPTVDRDDVFAVAGTADGPRSAPNKLIAANAWSGEVRFAAELPSGMAPWAAPIVSGDVVAVLLEADQQVGIAAYDRETGAQRYVIAPGLTGLGSAWLAVDDKLMANCDTGDFLAVQASTGEVLFRHLLHEVTSDDGCPRRLEPVLRSGALFVPQRDVFVLRPTDGEIIGQLGADLIPDLLRVDERCDVYIAEESGHVAAFSAAARLTRVK